MLKKNLFAIIYSMLLTAFTVYVLMDTFVITRVYSAVPAAEAGLEAGSDVTDPDAAVADSDTAVSGSDSAAAEEASAPVEAESTPDASAQPGESPASQQPISTETSYQDENITINLTEYREYDTTIYVADIILSSPNTFRQPWRRMHTART